MEREERQSEAYHLGYEHRLKDAQQIVPSADRDSLRRALKAFAGLLEAEWYNGNLDEHAYERLNMDLGGIVSKYLPLAAEAAPEQERAG